jgi:hypothetical protein
MASSNRFSFELNTLHRPADLLGGGDFHLFKRRGRNVSGWVQAAPLSELRQGLGIIGCPTPPNLKFRP